MLPNLLVILADDLDVATWDALPALRAPLEAEGTTFTSAFVNVPLCAPSRSTLLRGQYAHSHGVLTNSAPHGGWKGFHDTGDDESTLATWLQGAGYTTGLFGKYLNGYRGPAVPPGWTRWVAGASETAYRGYHYQLAVDGRWEAHGGGPEDYLDDVIAASADDFLRHAANRTEPWFVLVTPYAVHQPAPPPPGAEVDDAQAPRPPSFDEPDVSDKPSWIQKLQLRPADLDAIDQLQSRRLTTGANLARIVDRLVHTLKETGQLDNTYILFTSDNGFHLGEHRLGPGKETPYEEDIHVPLVIRGPGVLAGSRVDALVANVDLAPTLAQLGGVAPPAWVEGRSLVPWLRGLPHTPWRDAVLLEGGTPARHGDADRPHPSFVGMRTSDRLYAQFEGGEHELYDLLGDPWELLNVATAPDFAGEGRRLAAWLGSLADCAGEACRRADQR
jgi:arylsulfatase A-like enzyme